MPIHVVGLGGTLRSNSSSEQVLRIALQAANDQGATTRMFGGADLSALPMYSPDVTGRSALACELVDEIRTADGVILSAAAYHGAVSGLLKNAIDYIEDLRDGDAPYLSGKPVGVAVTSFGAQAGVSTLASLRMVIHALRGWPTPYGAVVDSSITPVRQEHPDMGVSERLTLVATEVVSFGKMQRGCSSTASISDQIAPVG